MRAARPRIRRAMERKTPAAISAGGVPRASRPMISVSANTAHMLEMAAGFPRPAASPSSASSMPRMPERTCRKRPVPAAHLSFIRKSCTEPSGAVLMTLLSCPPMSSTTPVPGKRWTAPRAWQVISVTTLSAKGREMRPYPVPTIRDAAIPPASAQAAASAFSPASRAFQPVGRTALPNSERDWGSKITALAATEPTSTPATGIRFSLWGRRRMRNPWGWREPALPSGTGRGSSRACPCPYASGHERKRLRKNSSRQGDQETPRGLPFSTSA